MLELMFKVAIVGTGGNALILLINIWRWALFNTKPDYDQTWAQCLSIVFLVLAHMFQEDHSMMLLVCIWLTLCLWLNLFALLSMGYKE